MEILFRQFRSILFLEPSVLTQFPYFGDITRNVFNDLACVVGQECREENFHQHIVISVHGFWYKNLAFIQFNRRLAFETKNNRSRNIFIIV